MNTHTLTHTGPTGLLVKLAVVAAMLLGSLGVRADHAWGTYHWARTTNPLPLLAVDSVDGTWQAELDATLLAWSGTPNVLTVSPGATDDDARARKRCKMVSGQIRVCNAAYGYNGWLGLATIGLNSDGHIVQGTAKVNDSYSSYWESQAEKNHVMCQEVGHLFGLTHTSEDGSSQGTCMDYSSSDSSQWPNTHDFEQLAAIYAHLDSYNTYADEAPDTGGDSGGGCKAPPGKGCNKNGAVPMGVLVDRGPRREIWIAPREGGGLWVHHVRLAPRGYPGSRAGR